MIQRIQSIFLLLASGSAFSLFLDPMSFFTVDTTTDLQGIAASSMADGVFNIHDNIIMLILVGIMGVLALVAIFLFRNRKLQMTVSRVVIVASILMMVLTGVLFYQDYQRMQTVDYVIDGEFGLLAPLASIIFTILALVFIRKDDKLVRSMDRLR